MKKILTRAQRRKVETERRRLAKLTINLADRPWPLPYNLAQQATDLLRKILRQT